LASGTVKTAGDLLSNTAGDLSGTVKSLGSNVSGTLTSAVSGVGDLAKDLVHETTDTLKQLAKSGNTYDANGNLISGTNGVMQNGVMQNGVLLNGNPVMGSVTGQPIDVYSYYGALPAKTSSDFRPLTADFSKFDNFA
jgi:hypothetical protein